MAHPNSEEVLDLYRNRNCVMEVTVWKMSDKMQRIAPPAHSERR